MTFVKRLDFLPLLTIENFRDFLLAFVHVNLLLKEGLPSNKKQKKKKKKKKTEKEKSDSKGSKFILL